MRLHVQIISMWEPLLTWHPHLKLQCKEAHVPTVPVKMREHKIEKYPKY